MSDPVTELTRRANELPVEDRGRLAEALLASLHTSQDHQVEAAWDSEIRRRIDEIENGTAMLISAQDAFAEVRRALR